MTALTSPDGEPAGTADVLDARLVVHRPGFELDLRLRAAPGEVVALLGPNGAGKTTTVGMLTTRVIPTEGRATVAGVDVVAHPSEAKALMGVVSWLILRRSDVT